MYVQRLLQIHVATMAALGTLLLGMGLGDARLPFWMLIAAITSVWLTDVTGWFRLNRFTINLVSVAALVFFLWWLVQLRGMVQILLTIGYLLVVLQVILLFQEKESRTYWQLALLSLLQVVVAAVFRQKILFGLIMVVYLFVSLSTLVLAFLHRERSRHRPAANRSPAPVAGPRRWPLAGQEPAFSDATSGYAGQAGIGRELRGRVAGMALGTLAFSVLVFFSFPRWGQNPWRGAGRSSLLAVGFSGKVTLGELGSIIENPEEVLRIGFSDCVTGEPYQVVSTLYVRGVELTHYEQGEWEYRGLRGPLAPDPSRFVEFARSRFGVKPVRQKIVIEPTDHQHDLFCVWPFVDESEDQGVEVDRNRQRILRASGTASSRFAYQLVTTAFYKGMQWEFVPVPDDGPSGAESLVDPLPNEGPGALPRLVAQAEHWVAEAGRPAENRYGCARLFERQLRDSGQFEYSLEGQARDLSMDPIEDFITNNRRGHCEYFATALTLMLRSRGIPARMVVGFKCDEWNRVGRFFQVRQLHAHTWVEAYLEPGQVPSKLLPGEQRSKRPSGGWLRLDPTPAGSGAEISRLLDALGKSFEWLDLVWANYVIELDRPRQQKSIYDPVSDAVTETARRLVDPNWWRTVFRNLGAALGTGLRNLVIGFAVAVGLVLLIVAVRLIRALVRKWWLRLAARMGRTPRRAGSNVEFYRRLEAVLNRFGLARRTSQTQREFARQAGHKIAESTGRRRLTALPGQVAEAFYRVRFGGTALDNPQQEAVEQALRELKQAAGESCRQ